MKILYGVQATGNGHITRARAMRKALSTHQLDVDYLFSGREKQDLFDMEEFGNFRCHSGLTFVTEAGSVKPIATVLNSSPLQLIRDIRSLDLNDYDLVLTDFEPITAWAARKQNKISIAVGHQYAFDHNIPKRGNNPATGLFMKYFAPAKVRLGLHWHHFGQPILPPIADTHKQAPQSIKNKIIVYLGFEKTEAVIDYLKPIKDFDFFIYAAIDKAEDRDNIKLRPLSRDGFQKDLADCNGVITNAGFELASEAIHLGKKLLVKPLKGQMEQLSNAEALDRLKLGISMDSLDRKILEKWLLEFEGKQVIYPSVPDALAKWIKARQWENTDLLVKELWDSVDSPDIKNFTQLTV
jgi:uncharacterized protein (TIGR00661 family)